MRVLHIIAGLSPNAGTSCFCVELCGHLQALGVETAIAVGNPPAAATYPSRTAVLRLDGRHPEALPWRPDLAHVHGLWDLCLHRGVRAIGRQNVPCICSPHGMLAPWSFRHHAWKKRLAWRFYQARDLRRAALLHATAGAEVQDFRRLGLHAPVVIAPVGIDLPEERAAPGPATADRRRTILFLSRLHPKKGLRNLVEAWARVRRADWSLTIAGPDDVGHRAEIETLAHRCGVRDDLAFPGAVHGADKVALYRSADLFVLPTYSENFGVVVAEALANGVPVITTRGTPWRELESVRCGWWIDIGVEPLARALREAMDLTDEQRRALGANGRRLVAEKYRWESVAQRMLEAYAWVLSGGPHPPCVHPYDREWREPA